MPDLERGSKGGEVKTVRLKLLPAQSKPNRTYAGELYEQGEIPILHQGITWLIFHIYISDNFIG
jgi:hypothetical protein